MTVLIRKDNTIDTTLTRLSTSKTTLTRVRENRRGAGIGNMTFDTIKWTFDEIDVPFNDTSISVYNRIILDAVASTRVTNVAPIFTRV